MLATPLHRLRPLITTGYSNYVATRYWECWQVTVLDLKGVRLQVSGVRNGHGIRRIGAARDDLNLSTATNIIHRYNQRGYKGKSINPNVIISAAIAIFVGSCIAIVSYILNGKRASHSRRIAAIDSFRDCIAKIIGQLESLRPDVMPSVRSVMHESNADILTAISVFANFVSENRKQDYSRTEKTYREYYAALPRDGYDSGMEWPNNSDLTKMIEILRELLSYADDETAPRPNR